MNIAWKTIYLGIFSTTVLVLPWFLIDAATLPKFTSLLVLSAILSKQLVTSAKWNYASKFSRLFYLMHILIIIIILISFITSRNLVLNLFGEYGRFFGAATLLGLIVVTYFFFEFSSEEREIELLYLFQISVFVVSIYYAFQYFGADFAEWESWYGVPSSFLGNPNFVSSFVAIGLLSLGELKIELPNKKSEKSFFGLFNKVLFAKYILSSLYVFVLITNGSKQGFAIVIFGYFLIFSRSLKSKIASKIFWAYNLICFAFLLFTIVFFYDKFLQLSEVRSRFLFLSTAYRIAIDQLPFGVGFGEYAYFFRSKREMLLADKLNISPDVYSDSSHNLFADLFVSAGPILTLLYFFTFVMVAYRFIKNPEIRTRTRWSFFIILVGVVVQAMVSPPQLSLILWGHISLGVIASKTSPTAKIKKSVAKPVIKYDTKRVFDKSQTPKFFFRKASSIALPTIFLVIAFFPLKSDFSFRESLYTQDLNEIQEKSMSFPTNSARLRYAASVMCANQNPEKAALILDFALEKNSRDFENLSYYLRQELPLQKRLSLAQALHNLDPEPEQNSVPNIMKMIPDCVGRQ